MTMATIAIPTTTIVAPMSEMYPSHMMALLKVMDSQSNDIAIENQEQEVH